MPRKRGSAKSSKPSKELQSIHEEAKNAFIATLAHELRNPLAALMNAVRLVQTPDLPPDKALLAHSVLRRQLNSLNRMVDDLLDASRATRGKIQLQKEEVELQPLIQHVVETFEAAVDEEAPEIQLDLPAEPVVLSADSMRLEQVLTNLLSNAYKFSTPPRRIAIRGGLINHNGTQQVEIRVRDQGLGIAPDLLPRVFDLFMQADASSRRRHGGLGIGLALVKNLTELHGGTVEVQSAGPGKGSEFTVILPLE